MSGADNPSHSFIQRHDRKVLRRILEELPGLIEDLDDAILKQTHLGARYGTRGRSRGEPLPYDPAAAEIADQLRNCLGTWVRLTYEHRGITYDGPNATTALARWLYGHLTALSMTPGSENALGEIQALKRAAEAIVCPAPGVLPPMDAERLEEARLMYLGGREVAILARELGELYRNLTQRRVHVLAEAGLIRPIPGPWRIGYPHQYSVGDVLDAHLRLPIRQRHRGGSAA